MKVKAFNMLRDGLTVSAALGKVGSVITRVGYEVIGRVGGGITADEAQDIGLSVLEGENLRVNVRGHDVLDTECEQLLGQLVARLARNIVVALQGKDPDADGE